MSEQEERELCIMLAKLLIDMNHDDGEIYNRCDLGFTIAGKRVTAHIKFEVGDGS